MEISSKDIFSFVFLLGSVQGLILSGFLFGTKTNKIANRLLGLLTLTWSLTLIMFTFALKGFMNDYPHLLRTISHLEFAIFPLLYLFIKYLLKRYDKFNRRDLLHFIPLVFISFLFSKFYFESAETKYYLVSTNSGYYFILNVISDELLALQGIIYSVISLVLIKKYNTSVLNYRSNNDKLLIRFIGIGIVALFISWIIGTIAVNVDIFDIYVSVDLFIYVYLTIVFIIYLISYVAIRSEEIYKLSDEQLSDSVITASSLSHPQAEKIQSYPDNPEFDQLNEKLLIYMDDKKPYLNQDLSFKDITDDLQFSRNQLSGIINQIHGVNFYEFVNTYRVNEVKMKMADPNNKQYKIMTLAHDSGFNSKASFNRIFKQFTQHTPSQYMKSL